VVKDGIIMHIKRSIGKKYKFRCLRVINKGVGNMDICALRNNKVALKALLMKNVKTDTQGRVLLSKNDEWRDENKWEVGGDYVDNVLFIENYMCNEDEKCEWDTISDIFSKAVHKKNMSKSDIVKMIAQTKNEVWKR